MPTDFHTAPDPQSPSSLERNGPGNEDRSENEDSCLVRGQHQQLVLPPPASHSRSRANSHLSDDLTDPALDNLRVLRFQSLIYPQLLADEIPITMRAKETVLNARQEISNIVRGKDDRLLVIVGPCSIHDPKAAIEYAQRLRGECKKHEADLQIVMRVYFEKPRTTVGWKGLINDPDLDETFRVNKGLRIGRRLLSDISSLRVPVGCEYLDTLIPQYTTDLVSWSAIGARTTECQLHRELASGLSMPVGFKNGTSGSVQIAVDACVSARRPHAFLGITKHGLPAICHSSGNPDVHVILRGSSSGPNFSENDINQAITLLKKYDCEPRLIVDFSHGNSGKDHQKQKIVCNEICQQLERGSQAVMGVMIESHLNEGNQDMSPFVQQHRSQLNANELRWKSFSMEQDTKVLDKLKYGVSVTDKCLHWEDTLQVLQQLAKAVRARRKVLYDAA